MQVPGLHSSLLTGLCPSILLLCRSPFVRLAQQLSGSSQPARRAEGCSQGLDCCNLAGSLRVSRLFSVRVTSVYHPPSHHLHQLNRSLQPHPMQSDPCPLLHPVFSRSSASGSASQVLCFQDVLGSRHYQQGQDLISWRCWRLAPKP